MRHQDFPTFYQWKAMFSIVNLSPQRWKYYYPIQMTEPVVSIVTAKANEKRSILLATTYSNGELDRFAAL